MRYIKNVVSVVGITLFFFEKNACVNAVYQSVVAIW